MLRIRCIEGSDVKDARAEADGGNMDIRSDCLATAEGKSPRTEMVSKT